MPNFWGTGAPCTYLQNTMVSFEHVDSWAKSLLFRTHHLWNSTTELTLSVEGIKIVHNFRVSDRWYVKSSIKSLHKYIETSKVILIVIHFFGQSKEKFTQIKVFWVTSKSNLSKKKHYYIGLLRTRTWLRTLASGINIGVHLLISGLFSMGCVPY